MAAPTVEPRTGALVYPDRESAAEAIKLQPRRSRPHMRALYTAAWDGWIIEWNKTVYRYGHRFRHLVIQVSGEWWSCFQDGCRECTP
jgi:hypothetical protein